MTTRKLFAKSELILFFIVFLAIGVAISFLFQNSNLNIPITKAATSTNAVYGYAWSSNTGWISFNRCDENGVCMPGADYDVRIVNEGTNYFLQGYAWSSNIGWIKFYGTSTVGDPTWNPPASPNEPVKIDPNTYQLSGWARACPKRNPSDDWNTACSNLGDSMGWINFSGGTASTSLDTSVVPNEFLGWAWGGSGSFDPASRAVIGWISLNCRDRGVCEASPYKVYTTFAFNNPPEITDFIASNPSETDLCNAAKTDDVSAALLLSWTIYDPDSGDSQSRYRLDIINLTSGATSTYSVTGSGNSFTFRLSDVNEYGPMPLQSLKYNESYEATLTVWDSKNAASDPVSITFTTPEKYPKISFTTSSTRAILGQPLTFTNTSISTAVITCQWDMGDGYSTTTNCNENDSFQYTYTSQGNKLVTLTGTDDGNLLDGVRNCTATTTVQIIKAPGGYREVP